MVFVYIVTSNYCLKWHFITIEHRSGLLGVSSHLMKIKCLKKTFWSAEQRYCYATFDCSITVNATFEDLYKVAVILWNVHFYCEICAFCKSYLFKLSEGDGTEKYFSCEWKSTVLHFGIKGELISQNCMVVLCAK